MTKKLNLITIILLLLFLLILFIVKNNNYINKNIITIKSMTQSENESNLQKQIDELNIVQEEYANNVQAYKKQIADAITNQGIATSENDSGSVMAENIGKILSVSTTATATAANITKGKTAWVNGVLITGTGEDNTSYYNQGVNIGYTSGACCGFDTWTSVRNVAFTEITPTSFELFNDAVKEFSIVGTSTNGIYIPENGTLSFDWSGTVNPYTNWYKANCYITLDSGTQITLFTYTSQSTNLSTHPYVPASGNIDLSAYAGQYITNFTFTQSSWHSSCTWSSYSLNSFVVS